MAPSVREVQFEMDKMRELLRRVLRVSFISADLSDVVSLLLKGLRDLEVMCPKLMCHLHVSGVSEATGQSFFVVLHDSALDKNKAARRVVNSVYTHLHSEASMAMTSALWLASRPTRPSVAPGAGAGSQPTDHQASTKPNDVADPKTVPPTRHEPGGVQGDQAEGGEADEAAATSTPNVVPPVVPPDIRDAAGQPGGNDEPLPPKTMAPHTPQDPMMELSSGFRAPEVHVPSSNARQQVEALFTARKSGWSATLRETLVEMRTVLRAHHGVTHPPRLMGMLKWWPVNLDASAEMEADGAAAGVTNSRRSNIPLCAHFAYPVLVERRHLPIRERLRERDDLEEEVVEVSNVVPPRSEFIYGVVATILLLLDKEPCVEAVVSKKLAAFGIVVPDVAGEKTDDAAPSGSDVDLDDFLDQPDSPRASPPPLDVAESAANEGGAVAVQGATLAARLAARQQALAVSAKAREAMATRKAKAPAGKQSLKRKGTASASASKRARLASQLDEEIATELLLPPLQPNDDVVSCTVLAEADMVSDMSYLTLATNWCVPSVGSYAASATAKVADAEEWATIVEKQASIDFLLGNEDVRKARQTIAGKADELRAGGDVDADERPPVFIEAVSTEELPALSITLQTLDAMDVIHRAALRLQALRGSVAWLQQAAKQSNARVPSFSGGERQSVGAAATVLMDQVLSRTPNSAVWRIGDRGCGGLDEDVVVPAHQIIGNMADVDMVDDIITVNSIVLQRQCTESGRKVHILQCSLFNRLLRASNDAGVLTIAEEVHQRAGGATMFAGVCNISDTHWVAFVVELTTKTVTRYDSGPHFVSLTTAVTAALDRVRGFAKSLGELYEVSADDALNGDGADVVAQDQPVAPKKLKVWSVRRLSAPVQDDTCSCGPFAFAFIWHAAHGVKSKLKTVDAAAVRMEMLATVVSDGECAVDEGQSRS